MDIVLYKNFSVYNKLNKNITAVATFQAVQAVEPIDDNDITLKVAVGNNVVKWSNCNYFQFDGAYYFIDSIEHQNNGLVNINGNMDMLMTYKEAIKELSVQATRTTSHGTSRAEDSLRLISADSTKTVKEFPKQLNETESGGVYIISTSQSGYTLPEEG